MTTVKKIFDMNSPKKQRQFHIEMTRTFGKIKGRWTAKVVSYGVDPHDYARHIEYTFTDPQDATLFVLKFGDKHNG